MQKLHLMVLTVKILITKQKVKFYDAICCICEKIERWFVQYY